MQSSQTPGFSKSLFTSHMQLLHLKPAPKLSIITRTYQRLPAEVLPNRCRVIQAGSRSYWFNPILLPMPSMTAAPPVWMQKWSTPALKFTRGVPSAWTEDPGANIRRFSKKALVAALGRFLPRWNPSVPVSSSRCMQQLKASSLAPRWVRTRHFRMNLARCR
ncbi:unnamed protein product [Spirodela intermedia]|uniref:Uncharacterized protein n=1 Tax=Spirodela intermedia TaxID=51605 RepID=A0A7I8IBZ0_SPIIN|nr:unnamed protein product [Spirodela intermedia]CAA6655307.1 unnamed protein product [Spirodela intermedia]